MGGLVRGRVPAGDAMSPGCVRPFVLPCLKGPRPVRLVRTATSVLSVTALLLTLGACGSNDAAPSGPAGGDPNARAATLRLGYFANVTHASAVYGVASGDFQRSLGDTRLEPSVFNAGPAAIEALRGGAIDATFIGPNPAINGYTQTDGELLRIVAGTTSGGASLVVKPDITDVKQLEGKRIATPQLGNTQDVAAKAYFADQGVTVDVVNQENAQTLDLFTAGDIDGGWVPEPWASRLVMEGGGTRLVDEASLWPQGQFVTTQLVVSQQFLTEYPGSVQDLLTGLVAATGKAVTKTPEVQATVNTQIEADTGRALSPEILAAAFERLTPTLDPIAESLKKSAADATAVGITPTEPDLQGIYDLRPLNALLAAAGRHEVSDGGLGVTTTPGSS